VVQAFQQSRLDGGQGSQYQNLPTTGVVAPQHFNSHRGDGVDDDVGHHRDKKKPQEPVAVDDGVASG
jgi:hypothetical protein